MRNAITPVPRDAVATYEQDLLTIVLQCVEDLPHAPNGKPVASNDDYADQVLKDMKSGQSREIKRLLSVLLTFLQRGAKRPNVRLFAQRLDAILASYGKNEEPRAIRLLNRRETREDGFFDLAQMRLEADPDDLQALEAIVRQAAFYKASVDELIEACHERICVVRLKTDRRSHLSLMES